MLSRAGTREVHNKLEKNRRAHLKGCYEVLKNELLLKDEDRKKTSNLAILDKAHQTVVVCDGLFTPFYLSQRALSFSFVQQLAKVNREQEVEIENLSKQKIELQKRLSSLKRPADQSIPLSDKGWFIGHVEAIGYMYIPICIYVHIWIYSVSIIYSYSDLIWSTQLA